MVGSPKPSANPSTILQTTSAAKLCAKTGVTKVAMLHRSTLKTRMFLAPNLLAQKLPVKTSNNHPNERGFVDNRASLTQYLTGKVSEGERGEDPTLRVKTPPEDVGHRNDRDGHYDAVGAVYEVGEAAERHDTRRPAQPSQSNHFFPTRGSHFGRFFSAREQIVDLALLETSTVNFHSPRCQREQKLLLPTLFHPAYKNNHFITKIVDSRRTTTRTKPLKHPVTKR